MKKKFVFLANRLVFPNTVTYFHHHITYFVSFLSGFSSLLFKLPCTNSTFKIFVVTLLGKRLLLLMVPLVIIYGLDLCCKYVGMDLLTNLAFV